MFSLKFLKANSEALYESHDKGVFLNPLAEMLCPYLTLYKSFNFNALLLRRATPMPLAPYDLIATQPS